MRRLSLLLFLCTSAPSLSAPVPEKGPLALHSLPRARFQFGGVAGERIAANIDGWLLPAPRTNPGLLEMFRVRDRQPTPQLVPWAGEFAGKYLLSCVSALRESERADLHRHTSAFVAELIATQAEDGYLGPFPKNRRLLGEWDLWGHYHVMQGLLEWHDLSGEPAAFDCVQRAAALICRTYLDGTRRVLDAGSDEMNMAISHVMAALHRRTGDARYLELVRQIQKDWERAGDYLRTGVAGVPFYKTPRPRWESLHDLQTLVELWRLTGETKYRDAFVSHWRSVREFDVRNSGAFSGGEQATGNPWAPTAIETCCTVAWMALSVDMLRLTGDIAAAEELERSTFNGALGSQHPCGRWWTYSTPMDGDRKSSAHEIVFQARAGTPELNCCSVNGPRTPGMLSEWAVMSDDGGIAINTHAPAKIMLPDKNAVLVCESRYPLDGRVSWRIESKEKLRVRFRIPSWAEGTVAAVAGTTLDARPGTWCTLDRVWTAKDRVDFQFPMPLRSVAGQREQAGKISIYRGPLLLAWDQRDNGTDELRIPRLTPDLLRLAMPENSPPAGFSDCPPWILVQLPIPGNPLRLRDFATAGMNGTRYRSWLRTASPATAGAGAPPILTAAKEEVTLNGKDQILTQSLPDGFTSGDFTVGVRVKIHTMPEKGLAHVFSAWGAAGDDPLRLVFQNGLLHARIEGGSGAGTTGVSVKPAQWHHIAAVKEGSVLTLFLDGLPVASAGAPAALQSKSRQCALGGNPLYKATPEFLHATFRDLALWPRALSDEEVETAAK
jgi:DUF1680 family protein